MRVLALALAGLILGVAGVSAAPLDRNGQKSKHGRHPAHATRECTPINGFYGYYGNPWCDTGSYRPPDIEFRERQRAMRMHGWDARR